MPHLVPVRLLHVVTRNQARGAERVATLLEHELQHRGWSQRIVALLPGQTSQGDLEIEVLARSPLLAVWALRREVKRNEPDVLLAHGGTAAVAAVTALMGLGTPIVWQRILEFPEDVWRTWWRRKMWASVANHCAGVVALSQRAVTEMRDLGFEGPVTYIPNHRPLNPVPTGGHELPRQMSPLAEAQVQLFGFIGHFVSQKDPRSALRVAERVLRATSATHFIMAGDGPELAAVRAAAAESPFRDRIHLLGHVEDVRSNVIPHLDVLMISSRTESMTGVAVEAVIAGCPVVSYDLDGLSTLLADTGAGILVARGDEAALGEAVVRVLEDDAERNGLRERAMTARHLFSTEHVAGDYDAFLRHVLTQREGSPAGGSGRRAVVHVMPNIGVGGAEQALAVLAEHYDRSLWRFIVVTLHEPRRTEGETVIPTLRSLEVPVISLRVRGRADRSILALAHSTIRLRSLMRAQGAVIVDSALFEADLVSRLASLGSPVSRVTHMVNTTYDPVAQPGIRGRGAWRFHAVRLIDQVTGRFTRLFVALTDAVRDSAIEHLGVDSEKVVVIPRGVDLDAFCRVPLRDDRISRLLCVGRLVPQKNHIALLRALARTTGMSLTILGEGPMRDQIATVVGELGLEDRVTLAEPSRDVAAFHRRHDAFVLPSKWEGQSNALLEAMASGMPILVSDIPVFREVVQDAAVFVSPTEGDIARGLQQLKSMSRAERRALGDAARERVASAYSAASTTRRLEQAYESLLSRS